MLSNYQLKILQFWSCNFYNVSISTGRKLLPGCLNKEKLYNENLQVYWGLGYKLEQ